MSIWALDLDQSFLILFVFLVLVDWYKSFDL